MTPEREQRIRKKAEAMAMGPDSDYAVLLAEIDRLREELLPEIEFLPERET